MSRFAEIFADRPVLADGAMGTVLNARQVRTRDLGGTASTAEYADAVCRAML